MVPVAFDLVSRLPPQKIKEALGQHPRDAKMSLARAIVTLYYGVAEAQVAEDRFVNFFQKGVTPREVEEIAINAGELLTEVIVRAGIVASKSELRRLLEAGAIEDLTTNGQVVTDFNHTVVHDTTFRIGKKRFLKLVVKN